ncbi:hypothetical protein [Roseisolibacter agri]|uniref:Uncharacterized protein n=1 Tax=Roseisolibacter agri TaxID=2014610 RepID=A0AA37V0N6_9BACT|nr:hypothetical protein [Roseisolibacter agri]GLC24865.1 hypothetical protein rosag_13780 [Roseisolibacter agri]
MLHLPAGDVAVPTLDWLAPLDARARLATGAAAEMVRVPVAIANRLLRTTIRLVADLPPRASGATVWVQGDSELLVDALAVQLTCAPALVTVGVPVTCDQLQNRPAVIPVPIAVGTAERPAGLVMATFDRLAGPEVVTARWSEAIAAFAWEALVHLAQQLSAAVGKDAAGRPLVPAAIGAEQGVLLVQPMARHDLSVRITR